MIQKVDGFTYYSLLYLYIPSPSRKNFKPYTNTFQPVLQANQKEYFWRLLNAKNPKKSGNEYWPGMIFGDTVKVREG